MAELTPMMKQYFEIKNKCRDYIVFYRLGDFYEMFFEDAILASRELELTLTGRDCGQEERAPMCGVPFHAYETYVGRLVRKGYKVAICEQVEDPKSAKGLVKREIVRMITPGTLIDASMLDENRNNFLGCAFVGASACGVCFCDISTGEVYVTEIHEEGTHQELFSEFGRFVPREVLLGGNCVSDAELHEFVSKRLEGIFSPLPEESFDAEQAEKRVCAQFRLENLESSGLDDLPAA
ncbi:MAG: DNA mismatch repair protein MutS, partial [Butyricicoccus sp.]